MNFELSEYVFPVILKDIDLGLYLIESKFPDERMNLKKVQIMMDNNVLSLATRDPKYFVQKMGWHYGQAAEVSLNPALAIVEQYLSNSIENAKLHVDSFEEAFAELHMFSPGYSRNMLLEIAKIEVDIRQQVGLIFCYMALLKLYFSQASRDVDTLNKWEGLFRLDIPRLTFFYFLGAVCIVSKTNTKLRFLRQDASIDTFTQKLFSERKEEKDDYSRWLRNRVFDLLLFSLAPTLSFSGQGGYSSRTILASKDQFIGEFVAKLLAWHGEQHEKAAWKLAPLLHTLDNKDDVIKQRIAAIYQKAPVARPHTEDKQVKKWRIRNLIDFALTELPDKERASLHCALSEFRIYEMVV